MSYRWSNKEMEQRELRRPQYVPSDDRPAKRRAKKNTRKWCKGKPGVEHVYTWKHDPRWDGMLSYLHRQRGRESRHFIKTCDNCGKHSVKEYGFYIVCIETERDRKWCEARMAGKWAWWG
jgi:hypothetical protein